MNKAIEEKTQEKGQQDNDTDVEDNQEQQRQLSLSTQAYKLFSEGKLIGTVASCNFCKAFDNWLGKYSPIPQIRNGKLWHSQHLNSPGLRKQEKDDLENAIINIK